jgi:hypothetical protein
MAKFDDLPAELQLIIFETIPENLKLAQRLNWSIRQLTRQAYVRYIVAEPVTAKEYRAYLATRPHRWCIYEDDTRHKHFHFSCSLKFTLSAGRYLSLYSDIAIEENTLHLCAPWFEDESRLHDSIEKVVHLKDLKDGNNGKDGKNRKNQPKISETVDLWTHYQILLRRLTSAEKSYAATAILAYLDQLSLARSSRSLCEVLKLYLLLGGNAILLEIPAIPTDLDESFSINANNEYVATPPIGSRQHQRETEILAQIRTSTETMYQQIRAHFQALV